MSRHLDGIDVVDFSAVYAGPICARMLSDCGADVVHDCRKRDALFEPID